MIVDQHIAFRECLRLILDKEGFVISGEAGDGVEALRQIEAAAPDLVIVDMHAPMLSAVELSREIRTRGLGTKVIALVVFKDDSSVLEAFRAGINAYVLRSDVTTDLVQAIRRLQNGNGYLSPGVTERVVKKYQQHKAPPKPDELTAEEMEVLQMIARGRPVSDIAKHMATTTQVVDAHRAAVMEKVKVTSMAGLVRHAVRQGYVRA